MTDHSQLVKRNDLARDIPRMIDNAGTASQNTSLVDDAVTREAITLNVAAPFLAAVSERDQVIDALQARVAELEAGLASVSALAASQPAPAADTGQAVVVPREPTEAMRQAGIGALEENEPWCNEGQLPNEVYAAMIAAAPAHPAPLDAAAEIERLTKERDATIEANYRQAHCIQQCSAHLGVDYSGTLEGLPLAAKAVVSALKEAQKPAADTGQAVAFERAGSDDAKLGWTLPVSLLQQVNRTVSANEWEAPTIEVTEIILLEAERLLSSHPAPLDAERVREACHDVLASLVAAVSLLKRGSKKAAPSDRMFDQMIKDYEASIERGRAALRQKEGK